MISIGKLVRKDDGPEEVERILATMIKYGEINSTNIRSATGLEMIDSFQIANANTTMTR
ncbi:MAG: hypothetical protein WAM14_22760 [Candidatus Nitrosopolaris sp.]